MDKYKSTIIIPSRRGSITQMDMLERQKAIEFIKFDFKENLERNLKLQRISKPLFIEGGKGLQDELSGIEQPVNFYIPAADKYAEVPHSLAKWKRATLAQYGMTDEGIVVDGEYIRKDEEVLDNTHATYVDQWDWELPMQNGERNSGYLRSVVTKIHEAMLETQENSIRKHSKLTPTIDENLSFVYATELEEMYPDLTPEERELEYVRQHPFTFIQGIGENLKDGRPHSKRAPDYDSWHDELNGDIVVHNPLLDWAMELSSMGIRVNAQMLRKQCEIMGTTDKLTQDYHQKVLSGELPQTIGGGIGQSRLAMQMMGATHIGEVLPFIHSDEILKQAADAGIELL